MFTKGTVQDRLSRCFQLDRYETSNEGIHIMRLSDEAKALFLLNKGMPIVGLIHKETKLIVLALCIPKKVSLDLNDEGEATSGRFISDNCVMNKKDLDEVNALLKQGYVPRIAYTASSQFDEISAHQFLFKQKCESTKKSDWGGFALTLNSTEQLDYTFVSGAFNSPPGKRLQGSKLSQELIHEVIKQTAELGFEPKNTVITEGILPSLETGTFINSPSRQATPPRWLFQKHGINPCVPGERGIDEGNTTPKTPRY